MDKASKHSLIFTLSSWVVSIMSSLQVTIPEIYGTYACEPGLREHSRNLEMGMEQRERSRLY